MNLGIHQGKWPLNTSGSNKNSVFTVCFLALKQQQQQHPFYSPLSGTTRVSRYQKAKTSLDLQDQEVVSGNGISWAICKSAPRRSIAPLSFSQARCVS